MQHDNDNISMDLFKEMANGRKYPLKPLKRNVLLDLARLIEGAYKEVCVTRTGQSGNEDAVTALLVFRLNNLLGENDGIGHIISNFTRNSSVVNFNFECIDKQPDLLVNFSDSELRNFPLAVEAKLIDHSKRKSVDLYYKKGIKRYVNGDYSWYFQDGFMIGYVRDGSTIMSTLQPYLKTKVGLANDELPNQIAKFNGDLATSVNLRPHSYPDSGEKLGPVTIWHLWM